MHEVLRNFKQKLTKVFVFWQKLAYFPFKNAANKLKHDVFNKIGLQFV